MVSPPASTPEEASHKAQRQPGTNWFVRMVWGPGYEDPPPHPIPVHPFSLTHYVGCADSSMVSL